MANHTPDQVTGKDTDQKQKELRGHAPITSTNPPPNQNSGKGAPTRHPGEANAEYKKQDTGEKEPLADGKGTQNKREDAALVKEEIRSRDA